MNKNKERRNSMIRYYKDTKTYYFDELRFRTDKQLRKDGWMSFCSKPKRMRKFINREDLDQFLYLRSLPVDPWGCDTRLSPETRKSWIDNCDVFDVDDLCGEINE